MKEPITPRAAAQKNDELDALALDTAIDEVNAIVARDFRTGGIVSIPEATMGPSVAVRRRLIDAFEKKGWEAVLGSAGLSGASYQFKEKEPAKDPGCRCEAGGGYSDVMQADGQGHLPLCPRYQVTVTNIKVGGFNLDLAEGDSGFRLSASKDGRPVYLSAQGQGIGGLGCWTELAVTLTAVPQQAQK